MKTNFLGFTLLALSSSVKAFSKTPQNPAAFKTTTRLSMSSTTSTFYDLTGVASDGSTVSASDFKGKVVYATNVASQ